MPAQTNGRPRRATATDELGRAKTLPAGPADFRLLCGQGPDTVLLGLGPEPARLPEFFSDQGALRYIECPELAAQYGPAWRAAVPAGFTEVSPEALPELARGGARILLYSPGQRLFPSFWGPILARLQIALLAASPHFLGPRPRLAWLPGGETGLMRQELSEAFQELGWQVRLVDADTSSPLEPYRALLAGGECPELVLSVNFRGLDPLGEAAHLLQAAGARVAVWCVDNPLHLISGLKSRFWTRLPLFVTDDWFLAPLRRLGAEHAQHLPLAARASDLSRTMAQTMAPAPDLAETLLFAGRSAFPDKAGFFAGCALPPKSWAEAQALLERGERPDFGWWLDRLGIATLWPGTEVRRAGFCAEETGRAWRTLCLTRAFEALGPRLTVIGDEGWRKLLPEGTDLRPPVDYYAALPGLCAGAACCLNCTSPLLPRGLTQRHFDTWAWGGLLLSDATPGLDIFPPELVREISFRTPAELPARFRALTTEPGLRAELGSAWRELIKHEHTYARRLARLLEATAVCGC